MIVLQARDLNIWPSQIRVQIRPCVIATHMFKCSSAVWLGVMPTISPNYVPRCMKMWSLYPIGVKVKTLLYIS